MMEPSDVYKKSFFECRKDYNTTLIENNLLPVRFNERREALRKERKHQFQDRLGTGHNECCQSDLSVLVL